MTQHKDLELFAKNIRIQVLKALGELGFGHLGGAMSAADVLGVLYGGVMNVDPKNPQWEDRDYFVMSKGHAGPALYAALALKGYFPVEQLLTINTNGTKLPSHPDRNSTTGVDMSTGSLGQGMSTAIGIAHGNKMLGKDNYTYLLLGDGESQEGQVWEGALYAPQHQAVPPDCVPGLQSSAAGRLYQGYLRFGGYAPEIPGLRLVRPGGGRA